MAKKYLLLDCDGVIFNSLSLIDEQVEKILYAASAKYLMELNAQIEILEKQRNQMQEDRESDEKIKEVDNAINKLEYQKSKHYLAKDYVLEEVCPHFRKLINYFKIYVKENTYAGVIDFIRFIDNLKIFDGIYVLSQCNTDDEKMAKEMFFHEYLPTLEVALVPFHPIPRFDPVTYMPNLGRKRSNKMLYFMDYMLKKPGVTIDSLIDDLSESFYVDDSPANIDDANLFVYVDEEKNKYNVKCGHACLKRPEDLTTDILRRFVSEAMQIENKKKSK